MYNLYVKMDPDLDRLSGSEQPEKNRIKNADISIVMNKRKIAIGECTQLRQNV